MQFHYHLKSVNILRSRPAAAGLLAGLVLAVLLAGCQRVGDRQTTADGARAGSGTAKPIYVASILPLASILDGIAGERAEVHVLLPAGASPHAYEPRPSDAAVARKCTALFYVDPSFDGWATRLEAPVKVAMFDYVPPKLRLPLVAEPGHYHGRDQSVEPVAGSQDDPHFWTDPQLVRAILSKVVDELSRLDQAGAADYRRNAVAFGVELARLNGEIAELLAPYAGESVLLFHQSQLYFLMAYSLRYAGAVESAPGKEPSPADVAEIVELARDKHVKALFGEPQLSRKAVEAVGEAAGLPVGTLDPLGTGAHAADYLALIRQNAQTLAEALGRTPSNM
jgi:zinc transport system substrate-binding protein